MPPARQNSSEMKRTVVLLAALAALVTSVPSGGAATACRRPPQHAVEKHQQPEGHAVYCRLITYTSRVVSKTAGLGRVEVKGKIAAVLQRDEGIVSLLDVRDPFAPRILGRYDDDAQQSLDGDLVFSSDGQWLFYARQTVQFSRDGIHVLDVSEPAAPRLASYQPGGGSFRIDYFRSGDAEYVVVLDAVDGLVINRFVRETGALVKVFQDAEPALKVGGPASAGVFIDKKDPITGKQLMYITTGRTGLQIYDLTTPEAPTIIGTWDEVGLAEVEVRRSKTTRVVYAATEYWFNASLEPEIVVLDAKNLDNIKKTDTWSLGLPADDLWRIQGMDRYHGGLFVAHSHAGLVVFRRDGHIKRRAMRGSLPHEAAGAQAAGYSMDVEVHGPTGVIFMTDAATGRLFLMSRSECSGAGGCKGGIGG